jgi:hypothetical protein
MIEYREQKSRIRNTKPMKAITESRHEGYRIAGGEGEGKRIEGGEQ